MRRIKCSLDTSELLQALNDVAYKVDGTGILMANGQWQGIPWWTKFIGVYMTPLHDLEMTLKHVMLNKIPPGGQSGIHVDPSPDGVRHSRWHLPLKTNPQAFFGYDEAIHMDAGYWHGPVEYWRPHWVVNDGPEERIHLVVDLL